jgi:hypothetical protein
MTKVWIAVALLAASWVALLGYYHQPDWLVGCLLLVAGVLLLGDVLRPAQQPQSQALRAASFPTPWQALIGAALLVPTVAVAPWPYKTAPVLLLAGLATLGILALEEDRSRPWSRTIRWLGGSLVGGGAILLAQTLALTGYEALTARNHELPHRLSTALAALANLAGIRAAVDGNNNIVMHAFRLPQRLAATWELLVDPITLGFLVGGLTLLAIRAWQADRSAWRSWRPMLVLAVCVLGWLPVRAVLIMAIYMYRVLRTEYDAPIDLMDQFWNTWVNLLLLGGPVFLAAVFVRLPAAGPGSPALRVRRPRQPAAVLAALGIAAISAAIFWNPPGDRKGGRVLVDEYHSKWEDTRRPFDTAWYGHESTYQFYAAFDCLGRFYRTGRIEQPITPAALADCDVLIVKVPTSPYTADELNAIREFVRAGGGLLLIGEHTNVFGTGDCINPLAESFGFTFRSDCLFDIDRKFFQANRSDVVPHPALQYLPREGGNGRLDWVVSCSIDPHYSAGRAVIESIGLKNLPADYYANNFYPQVYNHPYMRYGAFVQVWATRYGAGRVIGFGDSTQLSNFCAFEPGKSELQLGLVEWLNRREGRNPRMPLLAAGALALVLALALGHGWTGGWVVMLAAGLLGWTGAVVSVNAAHAAAMQPPPQIKPMVRVVMDRTVSSGKLPMGGFISGQEDGFGIFEMWMLRQGYFTTRRSGPDVFRDASVVVFAYPDKPVTDAFREDVRRYVENGGRLLVLDSLANKNSTANSLLLPFGLSARREMGATGALQMPVGWPAANVNEACPVTGGQPLANVNGQPVAAFVRYGKGTVTVIGFGAAFNDLHMGVLADVVPNQEQQQLFELEYSFMRMIVDDTLDIVTLPQAQAAPRPPVRP